MALRNIVKVGDDTLRKTSFEVTKFDDNLATLLDDMKETLIKADGVGLAAPQIGVLRRVFIVMIDDYYKEFINPIIVKTTGSQIGDEGCLSVTNEYGTVERPKKVVVKAFDRYGKPFTVTETDFTARAICHENDHLNGVLFIDKAINLYERSRK